jgi:hypothetical protein
VGRRAALARMESGSRARGADRRVRRREHDSDDIRRGESVDLRIAQAVEPELFVDEADLGSVNVRTTHRVELVDADRSRVVYRMEITGQDADTLGPELGPEISGDFPEVLAALARRAEG